MTLIFATEDGVLRLNQTGLGAYHFFASAILDDLDLKMSIKQNSRGHAFSASSPRWRLTSLISRLPYCLRQI